MWLNSLLHVFKVILIVHKLLLAVLALSLMYLNALTLQLKH